MNIVLLGHDDIASKIAFRLLIEQTSDAKTRANCAASCESLSEPPTTKSVLAGLLAGARQASLETPRNYYS